MDGAAMARTQTVALHGRADGDNCPGDKFWLGDVVDYMYIVAADLETPCWGPFGLIVKN